MKTSLLREVRAIEVAWRVRASTRFEHHRRESDCLDRLLGGSALVREFLQRRAHEDAEPLIGCSDQRCHFHPVMFEISFSGSPTGRTVATASSSVSVLASPTPQSLASTRCARKAPALHPPPAGRQECSASGPVEVELRAILGCLGSRTGWQSAGVRAARPTPRVSHASWRRKPRRTPPGIWSRRPEGHGFDARLRWPGARIDRARRGSTRRSSRCVLAHPDS